MRVLVIGASGMIGSTVFRVLSENEHWNVNGSIREQSAKAYFSAALAGNLLSEIDVEQNTSLEKILDQTRPDVVVNCAGLTKHKSEAREALRCIPINTLMPHRLALLCKLIGARLIHISTDCVFAGLAGNYKEDDPTDASDLYGKSKALGEVVEFPHVVTLRTSTIGHELHTKYGLLEWFLSQEGMCKGFSKAIFSGLPTVVFAQIMRDIVIPRPELSGLYHVAAEPINKFDLLRLIADVYCKAIDIVPDDSFVLDRSLDGRRFRLATGYVAPEWNKLIQLMYTYR